MFSLNRYSTQGIGQTLQSLLLAINIDSRWYVLSRNPNGKNTRVSNDDRAVLGNSKLSLEHHKYLEISKKRQEHIQAGCQANKTPSP